MPVFVSVHRKNLHTIVPAVLACYILIGLKSGQALALSSVRQLPGVNSPSREDGKNKKENSRPYWTAHKHVSESQDVRTRSSVVCSFKPPDQTRRITYARWFEDQCATHVCIVDHRAGRAPPVLPA